MQHQAHVLVIDDDESIGELICDVLSDVNCDVKATPNPREGLELLHQARYDLLILDIGMPELDGGTVVEYIRQDPTLAQLPILIMTAFPEWRPLVRKEAISGFISKPFMVNELLSTVIRILNERHRGAKTPATA